MTVRMYLEKEYQIDDDGHLCSPEEWSKEVAIEIAKEEDIELTERHWDIINFMRNYFKENGTSPTIRKITKASDITTKEIYNLFPKGPGRRSSKIAGLPKPKGCI